jgi:hypothetical protein
MSNANTVLGRWHNRVGTSWRAVGVTCVFVADHHVPLVMQRREVEYSQVAPSSSPKTAEATSTYFDKLQRVGPGWESP